MIIIAEQKYHWCSRIHSTKDTVYPTCYNGYEGKL